MLGLVFFERSVEVVPPAVVDEEASDVGLGLRTDHLRYDLKVLAEGSNSYNRSFYALRKSA